MFAVEGVEGVLRGPLNDALGWPADVEAGRRVLRDFEGAILGIILSAHFSRRQLFELGERLMVDISDAGM